MTGMQVRSRLEILSDDVVQGGNEVDRSAARCAEHVRLMRSSDWPSGTLGGRMAGTKKPRRRSSAAAASVRGWDRRG